MTEKHRQPRGSGKKDLPGRGGYKKSHDYEEHEYNKHGKRELLHIQHLSDLQEQDENEEEEDFIALDEEE